MKRIRQFFRTPKGLLTIFLAILVVIAAPQMGPPGPWLGEPGGSGILALLLSGLRLIAPGLASAIITAALIDLPILRWTKRRWEYPSGAVLTGMIVAMLLTPLEPWYVPAITSAIAIVSKYILRASSANVFNPAALGLVATSFMFHTGQSWWGALPDVPSIALLALFATGAFMADRVNKIPLVLVFLAVYFALFTGMAFFGDPGKVADMFRAPDLHAVLFFAFFILTDPPTSPVKYPSQIIFAVMVAVIGFAIFEWNGADYYLLAGVLIGNVWEAWHRWSLSSKRRTAAQPNPAPDAG